MLSAGRAGPCQHLISGASLPQSFRTSGHSSTTCHTETVPPTDTEGFQHSATVRSLVANDLVTLFVCTRGLVACAWLFM